MTNNNLQVNTALAKVTTGGTVLSPLGSQPIAGQWLEDIPANSPENPNQISPYGSVYSITGVTSADLANQTLVWPTALFSANDRMPAYWDFAWEHPSYCLSPTAPYDPLPNPYEDTDQIVIPSLSSFTPPQLTFECFINSPNNPDFSPSEISPQVVFDNAIPSTIEVHAFSPIAAATSVTHLRLLSMDFANAAPTTADSISSGGTSATFPFPTQSNGTSLSAGTYIATITTDPAGESQTTNAMEPLYVVHDDTSFPSAFGVDVAIPAETITTVQHSGNQYGPCVNVTTSQSQYGGSTLPLVTLASSNALAVGNANDTISVGTHPTVVLAYNGQGFSTTQVTDSCGSEVITTYTGAQSALVVNTGSNSVSLVNIGQYAYPSGTVQVGSSPVAAAINPAGTLAYVANYGSNTISEVNLSTVVVTRSMSVQTHPTAVAFDSNGNLWVGGQGYMQLINLTNWTISSTFSIDGTVTGMSYDTAIGDFAAAVLKNGNAIAPVNGQTMAAAVVFSESSGSSYSTTSLVNVASGSTTSSSITGDASPYTNSELASELAFPGQTAFNPPIYSSSNGTLVATANGTSFTVSPIGSNTPLVSGSTPYPIRGVKLTSTMLYLTVPDTNSLLTLPIQLP